jgi:hypothetical protein
MEQGTGVAPAFVFYLGGTTYESGLERHGQPGAAQGQARLVELAGVVPPLREGDGGKAADLVEVVVDAVGFESHVKGSVAGSASHLCLRPKCRQAALGIAHQGEEVGDVVAVERLGEFGQGEFTPVRDFGGDDARSVAPVVLADLDRTGRDGIGSRRPAGRLTVH